jgi:hypothetical protein
MGLLTRDPEASGVPEEWRADILRLGNTANPLIVNKERCKNVFRFMLSDLVINSLIWL